MKKNGVLLLAAGALTMVLPSCHPATTSSSSSEESVTSTPVSTNTSVTPTSSQSSATSTGKASSDVYTGKVKIYYHNDEMNYDNHCFWIWCTGLDGKLYQFDGTDSDFGAYITLDLSAAPWSDFQLTSVSFIYRELASWSGQSTDTLVSFATYLPYVTTDTDGKQLITVYSVSEGNGNITTYAVKDEALGDRLATAKFKDWTTIECTGTGTAGTRAASEVGLCSTYKLYGYTNEYYKLSESMRIHDKDKYLIKSGEPQANAWNIVLETAAKPSTVYSVEAVFAQNTKQTKTKAASWLALYDDAKFVSDYTYSGTDLGCTYDAATKLFTFKLWAPTAARVVLNLYPPSQATPKALRQGVDIAGINDAPIAQEEMVLGKNGVYSVSKDLSKRLSSGARFYDIYTYSVTNGDGTSETIDPYAKSSGLNGIRGYVTSPGLLSEETDPEGFQTSLASLPKLVRPNQLSVYEVHVRDFTADGTWISNDAAWKEDAAHSFRKKNGSFEAFYESGTKYNDVTTGFDSLKELGVSAIQLLPVFDQDNDERTIATTVNGTTTYSYPGYNWGYNPQNYDIVEGAYSSDPESPTARVKEYKSLIKACADNGMRVIMDVVYNHMAMVTNNAFSKVMPKYYFKTDASGAYIDETGVHNTFNTTRVMGRNYVVDSCKWWASQYGIKGFRFDLMGAIDRQCIREVKDALYAIDPSIVVYGEGWRGSGSATDEQAGTYQVYKYLGDNGKGSVGCFNDAGRDGLKGNTTYADVTPSYGYMGQTGDFSSDTMLNAANAYFGENRNTAQSGVMTVPEQTVNYASCHDNYTLYDQLQYFRAGGGDCETDHTDAMDATIATNSYILMSQGIAFIQGGEEIFRQKLMKKADPDYDKMVESYAHKTSGSNSWIEGDGFDLGLADGTWLVRNSYQYGDAVNSFKWDRKATYKARFERYAAACQARKRLVAEGYLGVSDFSIFGKYGSSGTMISRVWGTLLTQSGGKYRSIIGVQSEFSQDSTVRSLKDYYVFLGGRMSSANQSIEIGNGTVEVLYDSTGTHASGDSLSLTSGSLDISQYQCLVVRRTA